jgi:hypothetical protein
VSVEYKIQQGIADFEPADAVLDSLSAKHLLYRPTLTPRNERTSRVTGGIQVDLLLKLSDLIFELIDCFLVLFLRHIPFELWSEQL